jgi:hypothetical protein
MEILMNSSVEKSSKPDFVDNFKYLDNLYIMYYKHGAVANKSKVFYMPHVSDDPKQNLLEARRRADRHCSKMPQHRLSTVTKFVVDLDEEESKHGVPAAPNALRELMNQGI